MNPKLLSTVSVIGGIVVGVAGAFLTLADRFEAEVEEEVTQRINVENRLTRHSEKIKTLESKVWTLESKNP